MVHNNKVEDQMMKAVERLQTEFTSVRTGRAHAALLDGIRVVYYGSTVPINQVASISAVDARTLEVRPWDKEGLQSAEQAILKSELGINPLNDGKILRLVMPTPTAERRKELTKIIRKQAEEIRISIRNIRRDAVVEMKKSEKEKKISQDDLRRAEQDIQKTTDQHVKNVDSLLSAKEKEILEV